MNESDDVTNALRQLLAVKPQLLFRAAQKLYAEYMFDSIKANLEGAIKKQKAYLFRAGVCQWLGAVLIQSGQAHLEAEDIATIQMVMRDE